jgi:F0F1-type ATP synthase assembly protein I
MIQSVNNTLTHHKEFVKITGTVIGVLVVGSVMIGWYVDSVVATRRKKLAVHICFMYFLNFISVVVKRYPHLTLT